ncbi:hypothetical protein PQX77_015630 [Marasmius sp. AFHP31]|nr:hypothetical protein PQX77_015630 [Marasmius sp. AFHP31]
MALSEPIVQALEPYFSVQTVIIRPIGSLSLMFLFYGIYVVTFEISLNVAFRRREPTASKVFMNGVVSLFVLITVINAALAWSMTSDTIFLYNTTRAQDYIALSKYVSLNDPHLASRMVQFCLLDMSSVAVRFTGAGSFGAPKNQSSDFSPCLSLLDMVSNRSSPAENLPTSPQALNLAVMVMGEVAISRGNFALYRTSTNITNLLVIMGSIHSLLLSFATGGRIWWISREVRLLIGRDGSNTRYRTIIATILETGILYSASQTMSVALTWFEGRDGKEVQSPLSYLVRLFALQMAGLAPTLLIVRIAYGKSVDNAQQMISTLQFGDASVIETQRQTNVVRSTVNLGHSSVEADEGAPIGVAEACKTQARAM